MKQAAKNLNRVLSGGEGQGSTVCACVLLVAVSTRGVFTVAPKNRKRSLKFLQQYHKIHTAAGILYLMYKYRFHLPLHLQNAALEHLSRLPLLL